MKTTIALTLALSVSIAAPARAQLGGLSGRLKQAQDAKAKVDKIADLKMSDADERKLGEEVSAKLRKDFGVYQDKDVTRYVSLVGSVLAQASSRPHLDWQFIVLDTDGVNAFASPGGIVHITRGALGLIKNEAELAGVIGHEITHITAKHTVSAIQKNRLVSLTADEVGGSGGLAQSVVSKLAEAAYKNIISNAFDRDDEVQSDKVGIGLASRAGYAPAALADVLKRLEDRNRNQQQANGMFASHPLIADRVASIAKAHHVRREAARRHPRYRGHPRVDGWKFEGCQGRKRRERDRQERRAEEEGWAPRQSRVDQRLTGPEHANRRVRRSARAWPTRSRRKGRREPG
jgi:predicted Zn-dependent protease